MAEPTLTRRQVLTAAIAAPVVATVAAGYAGASIPVWEPVSTQRVTFILTIETEAVWQFQARKAIDSGDPELARWLDDGGAHG